MKTIAFTLLLLSVDVSSKEENITGIFSSLPIDGAIVVENYDASKRYIYNEKRARKPYTIASTFKIINTLIAVEENVVEDVFEWDGSVYDVESWNKNQTLESAFKVSCVWCYQQIAKRIGDRKYIQYLNEFNYGELPKKFMIDEFWLNGSLKLNTFEQIEFLKRIFRRSPPFSNTSYETLSKVMLVETSNNYSIYAKTGWAPHDEFPVGWYVGFVEYQSDTWFFATNLDLRSSKYLSLRRDVTLKVLKQIGVQLDEQ